MMIYSLPPYLEPYSYLRRNINWNVTALASFVSVESVNWRGNLDPVSVWIIERHLAVVVADVVVAAAVVAAATVVAVVVSIRLSGNQSCADLRPLALHIGPNRSN